MRQPSKCTRWVKGIGTYQGVLEKRRIGVFRGTGIREGLCRMINLGYSDRKSVGLGQGENLEGEGILCALAHASSLSPCCESSASKKGALISYEI